MNGSYFVSVQVSHPVEVSDIRDAPMYHQYLVVDYCAQRKPSIHSFDQSKETFSVVLKQSNETLASKVSR
jgi:hypothetical protein